MFANSQYAIKDHMHFKDGNDYIHEARVLVSSRGKINKSILTVISRIKTNNSIVDIIGNTQFEPDYYGKHTNEYKMFTFINGTLLVKGEDRWGNRVEIDITSV